MDWPLRFCGDLLATVHPCTSCAAVQPMPAAEQLIHVADNVLSAVDHQDADEFCNQPQVGEEKGFFRQAHTHNAEAKRHSRQSHSARGELSWTSFW